MVQKEGGGGGHLVSVLKSHGPDSCWKSDQPAAEAPRRYLCASQRPTVSRIRVCARPGAGREVMCWRGFSCVIFITMWLLPATSRSPPAGSLLSSPCPHSVPKRHVDREACESTRLSVTQGLPGPTQAYVLTCLSLAAAPILKGWGPGVSLGREDASAPWGPGLCPRTDGQLDRTLRLIREQRDSFPGTHVTR